MADPTVFGLFGLAAFLSVLGVNVALLWRHAPQLGTALGFAEARGRLVMLQPEGEPNVVMLRPRAVPCPGLSPAGLSPARLAA